MIYRFPKAYRLLKRHQFQRLSNCKRQTGNWVVSESRENKLDVTRIGITVTKRFGKAHERNKFKRLVREAFRKNREKLKAGLDINIKPRFHAKKARYNHIEQDLIKLFANDNS